MDLQAKQQKYDEFKKTTKEFQSLNKQNYIAMKALLRLYKLFYSAGKGGAIFFTGGNFSGVAAKFASSGLKVDKVTLSYLTEHLILALKRNATYYRYSKKKRPEATNIESFKGTYSIVQLGPALIAFLQNANVGGIQFNPNGLGQAWAMRNTLGMLLYIHVYAAGLQKNLNDMQFITPSEAMNNSFGRIASRVEVVLPTGEIGESELTPYQVVERTSQVSANQRAAENAEAARVGAKQKKAKPVFGGAAGFQMYFFQSLLGVTTTPLSEIPGPDQQPLSVASLPETTKQGVLADYRAAKAKLEEYRAANAPMNNARKNQKRLATAAAKKAARGK